MNEKPDSCSQNDIYKRNTAEEINQITIANKAKK